MYKTITNVKPTTIYAYPTSSDCNDDIEDCPGDDDGDDSATTDGGNQISLGGWGPYSWGRKRQIFTIFPFTTTDWIVPQPTDGDYGGGYPWGTDTDDNDDVITTT